jgi:hypothetical protein
MRSVLAPLRPSDGVACFARLYLAVTEGVQAGLEGATFGAPVFLARLDERFAQLFLDAVERPPPAWRPLFEARRRRGVAPIQFALAGMNAHINRDLPIALVATATELDASLADTAPEHADFLRVNAVLRAVEPRVKQQYLGGRLRAVDRIVHRVHRVDDVVAMWNVERARDAAWANAQALWALRGNVGLTRRYVETLDHSVGLASRGFLVPAESLLVRVARSLTR